MKTENPRNKKSPRKSSGGIASFLSGLDSLFRGLAWLIVILLLAGVAGRMVISRNRPEPPATVAVEPRQPAGPAIDWTGVDREMALVIDGARRAARAHADRELENWIGGLNQRVDENFIDWYFGYWNRKKSGFNALRYRIMKTRPYEAVFGAQSEVEDRIVAHVQSEFEKRVLRPVIAQREIETIARDTVRVFVSELGSRADRVQARYRVPAPVWETYLNELALVTAGVSPDTVPVTMKTVAASAGGCAAIASGRLISAVGGSVKGAGTALAAPSAASGAGKAAAAAGKSAAAKGAAAGGTKIGAKVFPPLFVAVVVWEVWDHGRFRRVNEPIMRENIDDYLEQLRLRLLDDPADGILSVISGLEFNLRRSLAGREDPQPERPPEAGRPSAGLPAAGRFLAEFAEGAAGLPGAGSGSLLARAKEIFFPVGKNPQSPL